ncbi:MAG: hypothetical protein HGB32_12505 [Geobacteraceae bacterium]|nr:hypothetical protein [Geobacteraceae bacterium]NTW80948.1 hypothetical protein [Geobacteraceae bacterium]
MPDYKITKNCNFEDVYPGFSANSCSPEIIVPTFEGLLINTPPKVPLSAALSVKVACSFAFSLRRDLGVLERVENEIVFTVVDRETNITYSGKMPNMDHSIPSPGRSKKTLRREELPDQIIESYVNVDLVKVVRMQKKTGRYKVYATVSTFKSNTLDFEVY